MERYYYYRDNDKMRYIGLLIRKKSLDEIMEEVENIILNKNLLIPKLRESLYYWYRDDCCEYAESNPDDEKEYAVLQFITIMNRVMSLDLLYSQFPKSPDLGRSEKELELFMLLCNHEINTNELYRSCQILSPTKFYKKMYENYLAAFVNVPEELYRSNVLFMEKKGIKYKF